MARPGVNITVENGALGGVPAGQDGVAGFVFGLPSGALPPGVAINTPIVLYSMADAVAAGVDFIKTVINFYAVAPEGTELWVIIYTTPATAIASAFSVSGQVGTLINASGGRIRLVAATEFGYSPSAFDRSAAQSCAEAFAAQFKPFRVILDAYDWDGNVGTLVDLRAEDNNKVSMLLSNSDSSQEANLGLLLAWLATLPVQRKIHRVKNGSLPVPAAYFTDGTTVESKEASWDAIYNKGYIFIGTHPNISGYYFIDDPTAAPLSDDYSSLSRGRVIDKMIVLAQQVYVREIGDEVQLDANGKIDPATAKALQGQIESTINTAMVANGELVAVQATIDLDQNVLATDQLQVKLRGLPVGYKNFIEVGLGFTTSIA